MKYLVLYKYLTKFVGLGLNTTTSTKDSTQHEFILGWRSSELPVSALHTLLSPIPCGNCATTLQLQSLPFAIKAPN